MSTTPTAVEQEVLRALREIRFGSLEITIHDGRVVQIERREKLRPQPQGASPEAPAPADRHAVDPRRPR